jgi:hypothetical protein
MSETSNTSDTGSIYAKLLRMAGILRDVYRECGGAERAILEEREGYWREPGLPNEGQK